MTSSPTDDSAQGETPGSDRPGQSSTEPEVDGDERGPLEFVDPGYDEVKESPRTDEENVWDTKARSK